MTWNAGDYVLVSEGNRGTWNGKVLGRSHPGSDMYRVYCINDGRTYLVHAITMR